jgi:hypothetical protein
MPTPTDTNLSPSVSDFQVNLAAVVGIASGVITYLGALYEMDSPAMPHGHGQGNPPRALPAADVVDNALIPDHTAYLIRHAGFQPLLDCF